MNWIKLSTHAHPDFNKVVWLVQMPTEKTKNPICASGHLQKIDSEGLHFNTSSLSSFESLFSSFLGNYSAANTTFVPTHYAEIELPKD